MAHPATRRLSRPRLGLTIGDPAGVGPEIVLRAFQDPGLHAAARVIAIGDEECLRFYRKRLGAALDIRVLAGLTDDVDEPGVVPLLPVAARVHDLRPGLVSADCGRVALQALELGADLCAEGKLDGLVTAPVHKTSLRAAGSEVEGQTQLLGERWGVSRFGMLVVADRLRVLLLTRHLPLRHALDAVRRETVVDHLQVLRETLERMGLVGPRLALAGFNPHAGEGGIFGTEDDDILGPAVSDARASGTDVVGPLPADSLFGRAARGEFDGVLALFHDQGLIAAKAIASDRAVTVLAGAPHLRVSVIHGAGFDRAGQNRADATNLLEAIRAASRLAETWKQTREEPH